LEARYELEQRRKIMKVKERVTVIFLVLMSVVFFSNVSAQDKNIFNSNFKPKSETNALIWSVSGTLIPVATGLGIWFMDKGKIKRYDDPYTDWSFSDREDPDRTLPTILIISGIMVGPSVGYFYGGEAGRGISGFSIRVGLGMLTFMGTGIAVSSSDDGWDAISAAAIGISIGSGLILTHSIYDIVKVKSTIHKHNLELMRKSQTHVMLIPKYFADSGAGGLELRMTF
jgi:hypothetical protein